MTKTNLTGVGDLIRRALTAFHHEGADRLFFYGVRYLSWNLRFHRLIRSFPEPVRTIIFKLIRYLVRNAIWLLKNRYPKKYTDADPYKCIYVDPSNIEYTTGDMGSKRRGWVVGGDWDQDGDRYMDRTIAKAIKQHFVDKMEWNETILSNKYSQQQFKERTDAIEQLYQHIHHNGYKSQRQLLEEDPEAAWSGLNDTMHPLANEVTVDIGRDGEILWNMCGQHRLAIAKVLDINYIPVQIMRRHANWQAVRETIREDDLISIEPYHLHPDLVDLTKS